MATLFLLAGCQPEKRPPSSPDAGCDEPDPRDPKGKLEGEPCETSFECNDPSLVCLGVGTERQAICTSQTAHENDRGESIELWDFGCWDAPEAANIGHCDDADLVESLHIDEKVGCAGELRVYEIPDTCCLGADDRCHFDCTDFVRHEVWRNCGCCWRMVQLVEVLPEECR